MGVGEWVGGILGFIIGDYWGNLEGEEEKYINVVVGITSIVLGDNEQVKLWGIMEFLNV